MATRGAQAERREINSSQEYELRYEAEKLGVTVKAIKEAKNATGSNDRQVIEQYLRNKSSQKTE